MNKHFIIVTLVATAFALCLVKNKSKNTNSSKLVIGTNASFPPFEFIKDGTLQGFDIDLSNEIAHRLKKEVEYRDLAFDGLLLELVTNRVQVLAAGMTPTPKRAEKMFFTQPYIEADPLVVITLSGAPAIQRLSDLKDKEIIVNDGFTAETFMEAQKDIVLKRLSTPAEAFLALKMQRGYAYVSSRSAVQPFFDQHGTEAFTIFTIPEAADSYALAVSKKHPELLDNINKVLDAMQKDGTLKKLREKWHLAW